MDLLEYGYFSCAPECLKAPGQPWGWCGMEVEGSRCMAYVDWEMDEVGEGPKALRCRKGHTVFEK